MTTVVNDEDTCSYPEEEDSVANITPATTFPQDMDMDRESVSR